MASRKRKVPAVKRHQDPAFLQALGEHCRKLRERQGLSIDRMSKLSKGLSSSVIHRLELGNRPVQVTTLSRYAEALGVTVRDLIPREIPATSGLAHSPRFVKGIEPPSGGRYVAVFRIEVLAGALGSEQLNTDQVEGWVEVDRKGRLGDLFATRISGRSMEPDVPHNSLVLFRVYGGGSRQGKILLVRVRGLRDSESSSTLLLKRYRRLTEVGAQESRAHVVIRLESLNPDFQPIVLDSYQDDQITVLAEFVEVLS